jgi:hypothetical protein
MSRAQRVIQAARVIENAFKAEGFVSPQVHSIILHTCEAITFQPVLTTPTADRIQDWFDTNRGRKATHEVIAREIGCSRETVSRWIGRKKKENAEC